MIFRTTDDRIKDMEKRLEDTEKKMKSLIAYIDDSFSMVTDVINKMEKDNASLRTQKEKLEEKKEALVKELEEMKKIRLTAKPAKKIIADNLDFFKEVAREGIAEPGATMYGLLRLVEKEKDISTAQAARRLGVHPVQIEEWAERLQGEESLVMVKRKGKTFLQKV